MGHTVVVAFYYSGTEFDLILSESEIISKHHVWEGRPGWDNSGISSVCHKVKAKDLFNK